MNAHKPPNEFERIAQYLSVHGNGAKLKKLLGSGTDGEVWGTDADTAVKGFKYKRGYENERDTYLRLAEYGIVKEIAGFWIPKMKGFDDDLMVVEMDIMNKPPFIIDFAKVRLNNPPDFSQETLAENEAQGEFLFERNWPRVKLLLAELESYLIYYLDPKPHNIVFPRTTDDTTSPPD